jgi:hypothetical protein
MTDPLALVPPINSNVPPGLILLRAFRATSRATTTCSLIAWVTSVASISTQGTVVRAAGCDHHMVDRCRQMCCAPSQCPTTLG